MLLTFTAVGQAYTKQFKETNHNLLLSLPV